MCYEFDRLYWLQRAEQLRKEMEAEKLKKEAKPVPAKPAAPDERPGARVPVPA